MKEFPLFWILAIVWILIFATAVLISIDTYHFTSIARILDAEVIGSNDTSKSIFTTAPIVSFYTPSGQKLEYRYRGFFGSQEYSVGDKVRVFYNTESAEVMLDDYNQLYLSAHLLAFLSFIISIPFIAIAIIYFWMQGLLKPNIIKSLQQKLKR